MGLKAVLGAPSTPPQATRLLLPVNEAQAATGKGIRYQAAFHKGEPPRVEQLPSEESLPTSAWRPRSFPEKGRCLVWSRASFSHLSPTTLLTRLSAGGGRVEGYPRVCSSLPLWVLWPCLAQV